MLTSQRKTQIVEEVVQAMLERVAKRAAAFNGDGAMMGDIQLPGQERLDKYWAATPDLSDIELITDPGYEVRVRQKLDRPPLNPFWLNLLRVPGLFTKTAQDFVRLNKQFPPGETSEVAPAPAPTPISVAPSYAAPLRGPVYQQAAA